MVYSGAFVGRAFPTIASDRASILTAIQKMYLTGSCLPSYALHIEPPHEILRLEFEHPRHPPFFSMTLLLARAETRGAASLLSSNKLYCAVPIR